MKLHDLNYKIDDNEYLSKFPIIYRDLKNKEFDYNWKFDGTKDLVEKIENIEEVNGMFIELNKLIFSYIMSWIKEINFVENFFPHHQSFYDNPMIDDFFIEFRNLIHPLEKKCANILYKERFYYFDNNIKYLNKNYKTDSVESIINKINWFHDGWWNGYYIINPDLMAIKIIIYLEEYRIKELKAAFKDNVTTFCKFNLLKQYRLWEAGEKKAAIKIAKKAYIKYNFLYKYYNKPINVSWFEFILNNKVITYIEKIRFNTNILMFLYRATGKKKYIKRLKKYTSSKFIKKITLKTFNKSDSLFTPADLYRPQQLLKNIEILIDDYCLKPSKSKKYIIKHNIIKLLNSFGRGYYQPETGLVNYFILYEIIFVLDMYLNKVKT